MDVSHSVFHMDNRLPPVHYTSYRSFYSDDTSTYTNDHIATPFYTAGNNHIVWYSHQCLPHLLPPLVSWWFAIDSSCVQCIVRSGMVDRIGACHTEAIVHRVPYNWTFGKCPSFGHSRIDCVFCLLWKCHRHCNCIHGTTHQLPRSFHNSIRQ